MRNESAYLRKTLEAMIGQTVAPVEWLLVDDGSTDDTREIVQTYADHHAFIRLVRRGDRGHRLLGSGVIDAFKEGLSQLRVSDYDYLCKLDGDMSFGPRYIEFMLAALAADPRLAAVSGKVVRPESGRLVPEHIGDEMVAGQFKFYRRTAYEAIGGFESTILWDGIDIHRCRMNGWRTLSFHDDDALLYHHRLMGSSDRNVYKGRFRLGRGNWFMGYHPAYAVAAGIFRMREKPHVIGGVVIICAYLYAAVRGEPRYDDPAFRASLQRWQLNQLKRLPGRRMTRLRSRLSS